MSSTTPIGWTLPGTIPTHAVPIPEGYATSELFDPFELYCGPFFDKTRTSGALHFAFRVDERHLNLAGACHGGMLLTFADSSFGLTVWSVTDRAPCVTVEMQAQFLSPARAGDLVEVAPEVTRKGRELIFLRGDFRVGTRTVLVLNSLWKLLAPGA